MEPLRVDSKDEELHFYALLQQNSNVQIGAWHHTGGLQLGDKWKWAYDLSDILPSRKWAPGEPNNAFGGENCLSIWKAHNPVNTGFNDIRCEKHALGFFCQKPKNPTPKYTTPDMGLTTQKPCVDKSKELTKELDVESQSGVCKLLNEALGTMLITKKDVLLEATDSYNSRKHKTVTVSITSNEYEY